jgi:hypothetical protein
LPWQQYTYERSFVTTLTPRWRLSVFEDLEVGDTFVAGPWKLSAAEAPPHPATVAAQVATLWRDSGVQRDALVRHERLDGSSLRMVADDEELSLHTVVVGGEPHPPPSRGEVTWQNHQHNPSGGSV